MSPAETVVSRTKRRAAGERGSALEQRLRDAIRHAQLASPHSPEGVRRRAAVAQLQAELTEARRPPATAPVPRGPKGARVGDVVLAERSRWQVTGIEPDRREAVCVLIGGSRAMRRFRARRIEAVERAPGEAEGRAA